MHLPDCDAHRSRRYSALPIVMLLADRFVKTVAPAERGIRAGRNRGPDVFADFDVHREILVVGRIENQIVTKRNLPQERTLAHRITAGVELALLIELSIVRKVTFLARFQAPGRDKSPMRS